MKPSDLFDSFILRSGGHRFSGDDFRVMCGPQVYMFLLNGEALYVGMSRCGLARAGQRGHKQAEKARAMCDEVQLWPTHTADAALKLEALLIGHLRPKFNRQVMKILRNEYLGVGRQRKLAAESEKSKLWRTNRKEFIRLHIRL